MMVGTELRHECHTSTLASPGPANAVWTTVASLFTRPVDYHPIAPETVSIVPCKTLKVYPSIGSHYVALLYLSNSTTIS